MIKMVPVKVSQEYKLIIQRTNRNKYALNVNFSLKKI